MSLRACQRASDCVRECDCDAPGACELGVRWFDDARVHATHARLDAEALKRSGGTACVWPPAERESSPNVRKRLRARLSKLFFPFSSSANSSFYSPSLLLLILFRRLFRRRRLRPRPAPRLRWRRRRPNSRRCEAKETSRRNAAAPLSQRGNLPASSAP